MSFSLLRQHLEVFVNLNVLHPIKSVNHSLAETFIISKIGYCLVVYSQLPKYQIQRLQKTQNWVTSYELGRCAKENDLIKTLSGLTMTELMDFSIENCCFSV